MEPINATPEEMEKVVSVFLSTEAQRFLGRLNRAVNAAKKALSDAAECGISGGIPGQSFDKAVDGIEDRRDEILAAHGMRRIEETTHQGLVVSRIERIEAVEQVHDLAV